ncbi:MAG: hypothetical protein HKN20_14020 [Gemmatimonadetes bacterium]|nr:hypothetical protein [Gemmatimonadota bacterium]
MFPTRFACVPRALAALSLLLLMTGFASAISIEKGTETFTGKIDELSFPRSMTVRDGSYEWELSATGSGLRTKFRFKVYEAVLYVAPSSLPPAAAAEIARPAVAKRIEMHFRRGVDADKMTGAFRDGFEKVLGEEGMEPFESGIEQFLSFFDAKIEKEETIVLTWLPGGKLITEVRGVTKPVMTDAKLSEALFLIWLGDDPVSGDLRRDLLRLVSAEPSG